MLARLVSRSVVLWRSADRLRGRPHPFGWDRIDWRATRASRVSLEQTLAMLSVLGRVR